MPPAILGWSDVSLFRILTLLILVASTCQLAPQSRSIQAARVKDWPLCPPHTNKVQCFNHYLTLYIRGSKRTVDKRALLRSVWHLCPPGADQIRCFDWYLGSLQQPHSIIKRSTHMCPPGKDKIQCFEDYMSVWVNWVAAAASKRDYLGKRSSSVHTVPNICQPGMDPEQCAQLTNMLESEDNDITEGNLGNQSRDVASRWQKLCSDGESEMDCITRFQGTVRMDNLEKRGDIERMYPSKRGSLCPNGRNTVACFDKVLQLYAQMTGGDNSRYIGRSVSAAHSQ